MTSAVSRATLIAPTGDLWIALRRALPGQPEENGRALLAMGGYCRQAIAGSLQAALKLIP